VAGLIPPRGVTFTADKVGGVPAEWGTPKGATRGVLLYLHGGAYVVGSAHTYRGLNALIARETGVRICGLDYRLAPEHPCPAAIEDALAAYRVLSADVGAAQVVIGGDSAGGGLTLATLQAIRDAGLPLPAGAFMISPWVDLRGSADSLTREAARDPILSAEVMALAAQHYAGTLPLDDPRVSPLLGDLKGLPRLFIQGTDAEIIADDSRALHAAAEAAGVTVTHEEWPGLWHDWQVFSGKVPEATAAARHLAQFVAACLS